MKIMICYDGSSSADTALEKALVYFKDNDPGIILITVVEEPLDASNREEEVFEKRRNERRHILNDAAKRLADRGGDVNVILGVGDPRKVIAEAIKQKEPDIVVVAKQKKRMSEDYFSNSVSAYLARKIDCRLLITSP